MTKPKARPWTKRRGKPVSDTRALRLTAHLRQQDLAYEAGIKNAMKRFGEQCRARRHELFLTQVQLGEGVGVAQPMIGSIELGKHSPRFATMLRLAHALKTTPEELIRGVKL